MKRVILGLLALTAAVSVQAGVPSRKGTVRCDGKAVAGVVVTDGEHCTKTDRKGRFSLPADEGVHFIYLSTPAGYKSPVEDGVVHFYLPVEPKRKAYDFTLKRKLSDETRHGFIAVADPQIFSDKEFALLQKGADDIRQTVEGDDIPFFGICAGDITSGDHTFYPEYNRVMATTGLVFRNVIGNHDMTLGGGTDETSMTDYEKMYGPVDYSFNVGRVHYVMLDDNFYIGRDLYYIAYLRQKQLDWLTEDLSYIPKGSTVVVTLHIPTMFRDKPTLPFTYQSAESSLCNYERFYEILEPYATHIISGHMHTMTNSDIHPGLYEHNLAALCGAWWQGWICTDGTPAGYGVFEVDGDNISWYYKSTGEPRDFQLKIYDGSDDPKFAGHIVANVWNYDSGWKVEMSSDGGAPIPMQRITAVDPEAHELYADPSKLEFKWITVIPSDHYFSALLPVGTEHVEVTATDRFGNVYRAEKRYKIQDIPLHHNPHIQPQYL